MTDTKRITDQEIAEAVAHANFGDHDPVEIVKHGLLARAADYHTGGTVTSALIRLGLLTPKAKKPTALGRRHLWIWFSREKSA